MRRWHATGDRHTYTKRNVVDGFDGGAGKRDTTRPSKVLVGGNQMEEKVKAKREIVGVQSADGAMNMSSQVQRKKKNDARGLGRKSALLVQRPALEHRSL